MTLELAFYTLSVMAGGLFLLEHCWPAHPTRPSLRWYLAALTVNIMQLGVFFCVDNLLSHEALNHSLFSLADAMPAPIGALLGYFVFTFCVYWWHRLRHQSPLVWRLFHQLHHSPQRIQTLTAYFIHPLDMAANLLISNSIIYLLLGLNLESAAWYTLITGFAGFFIHANIRVPRSVGYVFQTPEMHRLHHQSEHHANNYSDIVWWDMIFGTYCNPVEKISECGFDTEREQQIIPMLLGKDLYRTEGR